MNGKKLPVICLWVAEGAALGAILHAALWGLDWRIFGGGTIGAIVGLLLGIWRMRRARGARPVTCAETT